MLRLPLLFLASLALASAEVASTGALAGVNETTTAPTPDAAALVAVPESTAGADEAVDGAVDAVAAVDAVDSTAMSESKDEVDGDDDDDDDKKMSRGTRKGWHHFFKGESKHHCRGRHDRMRGRRGMGKWAPPDWAPPPQGTKLTEEFIKDKMARARKMWEDKGIWKKHPLAKELVGVWKRAQRHERLPYVIGVITTRVEVCVPTPRAITPLPRPYHSPTPTTHPTTPLPPTHSYTPRPHTTSPYPTHTPHTPTRPLPHHTPPYHTLPLP